GDRDNHLVHVGLDIEARLLFERVPRAVGRPAAAELQDLPAQLGIHDLAHVGEPDHLAVGRDVRQLCRSVVPANEVLADVGGHEPGPEPGHQDAGGHEHEQAGALGHVRYHSREYYTEPAGTGFPGRIVDGRWMDGGCWVGW